MIELDRRETEAGVIRIFERRADGARLYCLDASVQSMVDAHGVSLFGYVHAAKLLLAHANDVLILGGAGGSLATMMARCGKRVTVVEIEPAAEELARRHFGLARTVTWINADASTYLAQTTDKFDAIVVDACDADGLVSAFAGAEAVGAAMTALKPHGSLVLNLVTDDGAPPWGLALAQDLAALGLAVTLYRPDDGWEGNELLHVHSAPAAAGIAIGDLSGRPAEVRTYLSSLSAHSPSAGVSARNA